MSEDGGSVWTQIDSYYGDGGCCIVHPDNTNLIITGGQGPSTQTNWSFVVSYSTNGGNTWTRCNLSPATQGYAYSLAVAPSATNKIYAGGRVGSAGKVFVSTDFGVNWNATSTAPDDTVYCLVVNPDNANIVYAATPIGIYKTTDGGITWVNKGGGANLKAIRLFPHYPDTIVIGGDNGVLISTNSGDEWAYFNTGLENTRVNCLEFSADNQIRLFAGTNGGATYVYTFETGIENNPGEPTKVKDIRVYPTLTRNKVTVLFNQSFNSPMLFKLWDVTGQLIWQDICQSPKGNIDITLPDLPAGIYHLELVSASGRAQTKIVIMP